MRIRKLSSRRLALTLVLTSAVLWSSPSQALEPPTPHAQTALPSRAPKPAPPFNLHLEPLSGANAESWTLTVSNTGRSQTVAVWMWSEVSGEETERQLVWRGALQQDEERRLEVTHAPHAVASRVRAAVEAEVSGPAVLRATAVAVIPGRETAQELDKAVPGRLLELPTGERVYEVTGKTGVGR